MAVYINFFCNGKECKTIQQVNFDELYETWGDMLTTMKNANWSLKMQKAEVLECFCPDCNEKNKTKA